MACAPPDRYTRVIVTSGDENTPRAVMTRRSARMAAVQAPPRRPSASEVPARWSRRRGVLGVFAGVAALAFAGAYVGPAAIALTDARGETAGTATVYSSTVDDAQIFISADAVGTTIDLDRGGYTTWVKPKPKPTPKPQEVLGTVAASRPFYTGGGAPAEWMSAAGIAESDWGFVDYIVGKESGWNPNATNKSSGACGLVQALPCSKVPGNGYDPVDNLRWANGYATGRYGSWGGAYAFWTSHHWW
jgi:hypothetical protein